VADGLAHGRHVVPDTAQLLADGREGEGHVRAGVAIGDRVDVELVDALLVRVEGVAVAQDHGPQVLGTEARQRRHRRDTTGTPNHPGVGDHLAAPVASPGPEHRSSTGPDASRYPVMAAVCEVCGKHPSFGMNVSHSHRRTKRRWNPNIQRIRAIVDGSPKRLHVCTGCIKAGKVQKKVS
jgi:large subunit ribosomal protein L28